MIGNHQGFDPRANMKITHCTFWEGEFGGVGRVTGTVGGQEEHLDHWGPVFIHIRAQVWLHLRSRSEQLGKQNPEQAGSVTGLEFKPSVHTFPATAVLPRWENKATTQDVTCCHQLHQEWTRLIIEFGRITLEFSYQSSPSLLTRTNAKFGIKMFITCLKIYFLGSVICRGNGKDIREHFILVLICWDFFWSGKHSWVGHLRMCQGGGITI